MNFWEVVLVVENKSNKDYNVSSIMMFDAYQDERLGRSHGESLPLHKNQLGGITVKKPLFGLFLLKILPARISVILHVSGSSLGEIYT